MLSSIHPESRRVCEHQRGDALINDTPQVLQIDSARLFDLRV
jgi:hypothetical protein